MRYEIVCGRAIMASGTTNSFDLSKETGRRRELEQVFGQLLGMVADLELEYKRHLKEAAAPVVYPNSNRVPSAV